ncbi:MAG: magnesium/cobalt transporter CorA [Bacteroidia bacterium]|nr:magnesium/cobalt transporter CorA [Bacteroidia bacterium]
MPRTRIVGKTSEKAGLPPGSMVYVGKARQGDTAISAFDFNDEKIDFRENLQPEDLTHFTNPETTSWINVDGIHEPEVINKICEKFCIHPLTREDIVNTSLRPKVEEYDTYCFVVMKMIYLYEESGQILIEQVSFVLGENYIITFQEQFGDVFESVRNRIKQEGSRIRKRKSDYLLYALMDVILSNYFIVLDKLEDKIENLEERMYNHSHSQILQEIQILKRELIFLRRAVFPLREVINQIVRSEATVVSSSVQVYYRDLYDHIYQVVDTIETFRELLSELHDLYLSEVSNRMNEIMKVLTIISTIFMPLTFIAGIYGMNFKYMPELKWHWGYPAIWGIMATMALGMIFYFRRKKWF